MKGFRVVMAAMLVLLVMAPVAMAAAEKGKVEEQHRYEHQWMKQHGMDEARVQALCSSMEGQGMDRAHIEAVLKTMRGALDEGLPPEPFLRKAEEGVAKQVRGEAMVNAVERVRERYRYAHAWAGELVPDGGATVAVREAVADAMAAGMEVRDMDRVRDRLRALDRVKDKERDRDRDKDCGSDCDKDRLRTRDRVRDPELCEETALTLRDMARLRIRSSTAADAVDAALDQGYDRAEMLQFRHTAMTQVGQGNGEVVMNRYTHAIRNGASASELGSHGRNQASGDGSASQGGHGTSGGSSGSGSGSSGSGSSGSGSSGSGSSSSGSSGSGSSGSGSSGGGSSGSGSSGSGSSGSGSSGSGSSGSGHGGRH